MSVDISNLSVFDVEVGSKIPIADQKEKDNLLLRPWEIGHDCELRMFSALLADSPTPMDYVVSTWCDIDMHQRLNDFLNTAAEREYLVVTWNGTYDIAILCGLGFSQVAGRIRWLDGMQLLKRVHSNEFRLRDELGHRSISFGLKQAIKRYFNIEYDHDIDFNDNSDAMTQRMAKYCLLDSVYAHSLTLRLLSQLSQREIDNALIESRALYPVAKAWERGIVLSESAIAALDQKLSIEIDDAKYKLVLAAPDYDWEAFNINSPAHVRNLLYSTWQHVPYKLTPAGESSVDKETLVRFSDIDPRCRLLLNYRTALRNRQKFVDSPREAIEHLKSTIVHPCCVINGTYTGRMTVNGSVSAKKKHRTGIALHQWRRDDAFRDVIRTFPDHIIMELDASGQEFRWMAIESGDETMLKLCALGQDPHSYMGASIGRERYHDVMEGAKRGDKHASHLRRLGKLANLSLQYRTSAATLRSVAKTVYGLDIDEATSIDIHQTYKHTFPGVQRYWQRQIGLARSVGEVWTRAGRRLEIRGDWGNHEEAWSMESSAINFPIQGVGADQKYLALACLERELNGSIKFMFDLHDGLFFAVPDSLASSILHVAKNVVDFMPYDRYWHFTPPIPMPWDVKWGMSWGNMHPLPATGEELVEQLRKATGKYITRTSTS